LKKKLILERESNVILVRIELEFRIIFSSLMMRINMHH